ncbi:MAG: PIG-L family deacetylase [Acidobacteriota bacterium]
MYAQRSMSGEVEIRQALERLNTLGSVMMIAAHPDDENTALLAYLARGRHVRTAYLALTRGEGGQNLIGSEQGDQMGLIRTQELLAARRIDGAEQFFTRAIDFGFSKIAEETLTQWNREQVLADVVWNIRRFRPDVVVLRFTGTPRDGHGHHQASAILGKEAFSLAADPSKFPEQLAFVEPWQAKRLMQNNAGGGPGGGPGGGAGGGAPAAPGAAAGGGGRGGPGAAGAAGQGAGRGGRGGNATPAEEGVDIDLGAYSPELGYSYGQIAGMSRSQHRSQGMGAAERPGTQRNTLITLAGDKTTSDIFEGINIAWSRLPGGERVAPVAARALASFEPSHPEKLLQVLAEARPLIAAINDPLARRKLNELDELMALASGLYLEAQAVDFAVTPGKDLRVNATAIVRLPAQVAISGIRITGMEGAPSLDIPQTVLVNNQPSQYPITVKVPVNQPYSQPFWLAQPRSGTMYSIADQRLIGNADNAPVLQAHFKVRIAGTDLELTRSVQHRYVDRVYGELFRPLEVVPPVGIDLAGNALVFPTTAARQVDVPVRSNSGKQSGDVRLEVPAGWTVAPATQHFELNATDEQTSVSFRLTPPTADSKGVIRAVAQVGAAGVSSGIVRIDYPHIPVQMLLPAAQTALVRTNITNLAKNVGYIMGAGDEVPGSIRQLGAEVTLLSTQDLARGDLSKFDAIVTGVRAFNTRADLRANYQRLFEYANSGGTLVVQYNVAEGGATGGPLEHIGPYPIHTGRDRVTVEEAPITFPNPQLKLLHAPNEITQKDFEGWVQERGLNFPDQWDEKYQSVLESHDPGEEPLKGGMLYAPYGKGAYIFSAYDWFRELPAGVPGAYRLFANMLSAAKVQ